MLVLASWNACFLKNHQPTAKDDFSCISRNREIFLRKAMKTSRIISGCAGAVQELQELQIRQELSRSCRMRRSGRSCPGVAGVAVRAGAVQKLQKLQFVMNCKTGNHLRVQGKQSYTDYAVCLYMHIAMAGLSAVVYNNNCKKG
jgi:hypothetical protein